MTDYQKPVQHNHVHQQDSSTVKHDHNNTDTKADSSRVEGEDSFSDVWIGTEQLKEGDVGKPVARLQQALMDIGLLPADLAGMGLFDATTTKAVTDFQNMEGVIPTGMVDQLTLIALDARFNDRKDYVSAAAGFDPKKPTEGTRPLSKEEKKEAQSNLSPKGSSPGATFDPANAAKYAKEIQMLLQSKIPKLYNELYLTKVKKRKDPAKNFDADKTLEKTANAGKKITDKLYGSLNTGPAFVMGNNLIDQWADEEARNKVMNDSEKKDKAIGRVKYLINAYGDTIHKKYNASTSGAEEQKALAPVIARFTAKPEQVQQLLDMYKGWEATQLEGTQYIQRFKEPGVEANRMRLWKMFHVSIHEYIHSLAHKDYQAWAAKLGGAEYHGLMEGFCEFFTLNVRAANPPSSLTSIQKDVEGPYYNDKKPAAIPTPEKAKVGVYAAHKDAERTVGVIGIRNAQLGYFQGRTDLMGE